MGRLRGPWGKDAGLKTSQPTLFCSALPDVQRGQVWQLGNHRLMCGDATNKQDVAMLLAGRKPTVVVTSPPYADARDYNDPIPCWDSMMIGAFDGHDFADDVQMLINLGPIHRKGEWVPYWSDWLHRMRMCQWKIISQYIWDKTSGFPGKFKGRLQPTHEYIFHIGKCLIDISKHMPCYGGRKSPNTVGVRGRNGVIQSRRASVSSSTKNMDSVLRCSVVRFGEACGHPAQMPTSLIVLLLRSYASKGSYVYDPFTGSGTTLLACGQEGVTGLGMEISPEYVQMAIDRWRKVHPAQDVRLCK